MALNSTLKSLLSAELRRIGNVKCLAKVTELESNSGTIHSIHLRNLDLTAANLKRILICIQRADLKEQEQIKSISFSYNKLLGDEGALILSQYLNLSIKELGLVDCEIGDQGGIKLLKWVESRPDLRMVCIEKNRFSLEVKERIRQFSINRPELFVVY